MIEIIEAITPGQIDEARLLFKEYASSIGIDLCFQGFDDELRLLPGAYIAPKGGLYLAYSEGIAIGCVALRPLEPPSIAELKRLYVQAHARGTGVGYSLTRQAIKRAMEAGYDRIRLDTLPSMIDAQGLYRKMGFQEITAYTFNPVPGVIYMELNI